MRDVVSAKPKRQTIASIVVALAIAFIAGCQPKAATPPPPKTPQSIDELKKAIADVLRKRHVPGVGIALVSKDKVLWTGGIGKADLQSGKDVDADTMFRIGSITKGFVALAILQLQAQGKISLDTKLADLAPEVPVDNPWEKTDPITVANLLEHTAGFDDFSLEEFYDFSATPSPLLKTFEMFPQPQRVRWRPGTIASYSNPGYGVAGYLVEKASGKSCEEYIADNILRPLGMTHSDMRLTPEVKAALAQGYIKDPPEPVPYRPIYLRPAGEMKSSPNEMARFVRMMLNRGQLDGVRIVSADDIARMETPKTGLAARGGLQNGYALGNFADLKHQFVGHGHDGGIDGFLSIYEYMLEPGLGYFFSINSSAGGPAETEIQDLLSAYLTRGLTPTPKPPAVPLDSAIASRMGFYEFAAPRNEGFKFVTEWVAAGWTYIKDGKIYTRGLIPGALQELVYLGNNQFRTEKEIGASGVYCSDTDGDFGCGMLACFRRVNPVWPVTRFVLIASALVLMASSVLFAIIWIPRKVLGRMKGVRHLSVRALPLLAIAALIATFLPASNAPAIELAQLDGLTAAMFLTSIAFAILSIISVIIALRSLRFEMNRAARIHSMLVALSCVGITWYLAYWGIIGVRVWKL